MQNAAGAGAAESASDLSVGSLPVNRRAKGSLCTAKEHGHSSFAMSSQPPDQSAEAHNLRWERTSSLACLDHIHCRADEAYSRAQSCEVFWAMPKWPAAIGMDSFLPTAPGRPSASHATECSRADISHIALSTVVPAETKTSSPLSEKPAAVLTAGSNAMTWPSQLAHAHSVIAELSTRLARLECSNALLQDRLAAGSGDLIKSGPDDQWPADVFPWQHAAPAREGQTHERMAAEDINRVTLTAELPTADSQNGLSELEQLLVDTAELEPMAHAKAESAAQRHSRGAQPRGEEDGRTSAKESSTLSVSDAAKAGAWLRHQAEEIQTKTSSGLALMRGEEASIIGEKSHSVRPKTVLAIGMPAADHSLAVRVQHAAAPASPYGVRATAPQDGAGNADQPQHAPDAPSRAMAIARSIVLSSEAPGCGEAAQDTRQA